MKASGKPNTRRDGQAFCSVPPPPVLRLGSSALENENNSLQNHFVRKIGLVFFMSRSHFGIIPLHGSANSITSRRFRTGHQAR